MKIIFASKNEGKLKEVRNYFSEFNVQIISLNEFPDAPDIEETGTTFLENAFLKAKGIYNKYRMPVISDDSGLAVEQLNGEPGVFSARYAGIPPNDENNNEKLLSELKKFPEPHHAKFIATVVYYDGINAVNSSGEVKGRIISERKGKNGFGYDPIFLVDGMNKTMAELNLKEKNLISHRGKALRNLIENLKGII